MSEAEKPMYKDVVYVIVEYFTGKDEDDETGYPYFAAHSDDLKFATDGRTFDELLQNVGECLQLCLHEVDPMFYYKVRPDAAVEFIDLTGLTH